MHYLLGLAALVIGAIIATRRTRPTWFVVTTSLLVGIGALLAVLSYTRVTDPMGLVANSIIGWVFVGLAIITMLSSIFVLERRGEFGEELPPLIGDNPFDGDTDDSDDPAPGTAPGATGEHGADAGSAAVTGAADHHGYVGSAAAASTNEESMATNDHEQRPAGAQPGDDGSLPGNPAMEAGLRASLGAGGGDPGAHTDERPAEREDVLGAASDAGPSDEEAPR